MSMDRAHPTSAASPAGVVIGVDAHRGSHTAAALDAERRVLADLRVPADRAGYRRLRRWAAQWPARCWAVENAAGTGRVLGQWLLADGERVLDVPAKLSARVRLLSVGHGRKNDRADALSTALAAYGPAPLRPAAAEDGMTALRLLAERRDDLVARRTQLLNRLRRLLVELGAGPLPGRLSAARAGRTLGHLRPRGPAAHVRRTVAADVLRELRWVEATAAALEQHLIEALQATGSALPTLYGIGPVLAATLLGRVGDPRRFPSAAHFATYCGVAPLEVSSGEVVRHRLSRAGDRRLNAVLHVMATCQARGHPQGRAYYQRKRAEGRSHLEALRCLKRRLADVVYRQLQRDARTAAPHSAPAPAPATLEDGRAGSLPARPSSSQSPHQPSAP